MNTIKQIQTLIIDAEKDIKQGNISNIHIHRLLKDLKIALQKLQGEFRYLSENSENYKSELYRLYTQFKQSPSALTSTSQAQQLHLSKSKNRISQSSQNFVNKNMSLLPIQTDKLSHAAFPLQNSITTNDYGMEKNFDEKSSDAKHRNCLKSNNRLSNRQRSGKIARKINQNYLNGKSPIVDNQKKSRQSLRDRLSSDKRLNSIKKSSTYGVQKQNYNFYDKNQQDLIQSIRSFKNEINTVQNFVQQHCKGNQKYNKNELNPYSQYQPLQQKIHNQLLSLNIVQNGMLENLQKQIQDSRSRLMSQIRKIKKNLTNEHKILKRDQFEKQCKKKKKDYL